MVTIVLKSRLREEHTRVISSPGVGQVRRGGCAGCEQVRWFVGVRRLWVEEAMQGGCSCCHTGLGGREGGGWPARLFGQPSRSQDKGQGGALDLTDGRRLLLPSLSRGGWAVSVRGPEVVGHTQVQPRHLMRSELLCGGSLSALDPSGSLPTRYCLRPPACLPWLTSSAACRLS